MQTSCVKVMCPCTAPVPLFFSIRQYADFSAAADPIKQRSPCNKKLSYRQGPRDASCQLKSCQLPRNSAETTYTTSPDQIDGMKLEI